MVVEGAVEAERALPCPVLALLPGLLREHSAPVDREVLAAP